MLKDYYDILGLEQGASKEAIRLAYKKKAFEFHPDKNKSPNAHEQFIRISEAYEILMLGYKPVKKYVNPYAKYYNMKTPPEDPEEFKMWKKVAMARIRQKAKERAKMEFDEFMAECEAFKKSRYFYVGKAFFYLAALIYILTAAFLIALPFITAFGSGRYLYAIAMAPLAFLGYVMYVHGFSEYEYWSNYFIR